MTTKRKVLTIIFLILFFAGGLLALIGEFAGAFVYWFFLGVVFTAIWFLLGNGGRPADEARTLPLSMFTDSVQDGLLKLSKVSPLEKGSFVIFAIFILPAIYGRAPSTMLFSLIFGIVAFRAWCSQLTARMILERQSLDDYARKIYVPALFRCIWRSCITFVSIALVLGLATTASSEKTAGAIGTALGLWLFLPPFILDVPFWVRRKTEELLRGCDTPTNVASVPALKLSHIVVLCSVAIAMVSALVWESVCRRDQAISALQATHPSLTHKQLKGKENGDQTPYVLARAYRAKSSPVNQNDAEILLRFGVYGAEWNRAAAPLVRNYIDPNVTGDQWVELSKIPIAQLKTVLLRTKIDCDLLSDTGVKEFIKPIIEVNDRMLGLYLQLQSAIITGNNGEESTVMSELQAAAQRKQQLGLLIIQSFREQLGAGKVDQRLHEMISEISTLTTPE